MTWQDAYRESGYAILPSVLRPAEVDVLAAGFEELLATARSVASGELEDPERCFVVDQQPFRLHRVVWAGAWQHDLATMGSDGRFLKLAADIVGDDLVQIIQQAHFKMPGDGVSFAWHQDASHRRMGTELFRPRDDTGSFVQMAVAIDPMTQDNGPLQVLPGSHRLGMLADGQGRIDPLPDISPLDVLLSPGDVVLMHPFLVHGSGPNRSNATRRLFLQGYTVEGVNGRHYPGCGTGVRRHAMEHDVGR